MTKAPQLYEAMVNASHHLITIRLDREPRSQDMGIFANPEKDPQYIDHDSRSWSTSETVDDVYNEHFGAFTTDRLYETLDGPFLQVHNGQRIHRMLVARGAWDASRVGATAGFLDCKCSLCNPERAAIEAEVTDLITQVHHAIQRSAA